MNDETPTFAEYVAYLNGVLVDNPDSATMPMLDHTAVNINRSSMPSVTFGYTMWNKEAV